ncbi:ribonuclease P protein subunit p14-like [Amphiura filiformis]|uniref:ribonuclease P protein subunit p14-like n=1 Tax=Amphiura filiformis TaxID=82378 RepID=UPI003B227312
MAFERLVSKNLSKYTYLKVQLEFEDSQTYVEEVRFKAVILKALKQLHGDSGAAIPFDILRYNKRKMEAILRVQSSCLVKLWSALTLFGEYAELVCAFRVHQVSGHLMALAVDSRQDMHLVLQPNT